MNPIAFTATIVLGAAALAPACSASLLVVGREIDGGGPSACSLAGGTCVLQAVVACASEAPSSAQDCSTSNSPTGAGGDLCCLAFPHLGTGRDAGPGDSAPGNGDGGNDDSGGAGTCGSAGGQCVGASVSCARELPAGAQECKNPPNPAGAFCCLALSDAGPLGDAGAADGGHGDGGNKDSGAAMACTSAGGTCINGSVACAKDAPGSAQDCPPGPGGTFCCLSPL